MVRGTETVVEIHKEGDGDVNVEDSRDIKDANYICCFNGKAR